MYDLSFYVFLTRASIIIPFIIHTAVLVMGIIVTASKVKQTRILGLSLIFSSLGSIIACVYAFCSRIISIDFFAALSRLNTYGNMVLSLAVSFCICFYIHRTYNKKYIYLPVFLIPLGAGILKTVTAFLINRSPVDRASMVYLISLIQSIISLPVSIAITLILILAFYKNRNKETIIPKIYVIKIIDLVWGCFYGSFAILMYSLMYASLKIKESAFPPFLVWLAHYSQPLNMIFTIIGSLLALIFPIYLLISIRKASRMPEVPEA